MRDLLEKHNAGELYFPGAMLFRSVLFELFFLFAALDYALEERLA